MEITPDSDLRWLRPGEPAVRSLEAQRKWLISLAVKPLYAFFGKNRDETLRLQRRAQVRRFLRSRTIEQLDAIIVDARAPAALQQAAYQHRKFRNQIVTTTTIRKQANPLLPVLHRSTATVVKTLQQVGAVRTKAGELVGHLYEAVPNQQPRTTRLAGVEVPVSLLQGVVADQARIAAFYRSVCL